MERTLVVIGAGPGARITLIPLARTGDSADHWDANWLSCQVTVLAGAFRGDYIASLRAEEFAAFRGDLERLYRDLKGTGQFQSMEGWVTVDVVGDGRGHFTGTGHLRDRAGDGNLLACEVEFDQTDVAVMVTQLLAIEAAFPVLGKPAG